MSLNQLTGDAIQSPHPTTDPHGTQQTDPSPALNVQTSLSPLKPTLATRQPSLATSPSNRPTNGVPLASAPATTSNASPMNMAGPIQANYTVPARPKPGRKPKEDEPENKRKAQNRQAQRNFRERKTEEKRKLEQEIQKLTDDKAELARTVEDLKQKCRHKEQEVASWQQQYEGERQQCGLWRERAQVAEEELAKSRSRLLVGNGTSFNVAPFGSYPPISRPPMDSIAVSSSLSPASIPLLSASAALANQDAVKNIGDCPPGGCDGTGKCPCIEGLLMDVSAPKDSDSTTTQAAVAPISVSSKNIPMANAKAPSANESDYSLRETDFTTFGTSVTDKRPSINFITDPQDQGNTRDCGFCTDDSNCICIQEQSGFSVGALQEKLDRERNLPPPVSENCTGAGTCKGCQEDPLQRQFCMAMNAPPSQRESFLAKTLAQSITPSPRQSLSGPPFKRARLESIPEILTEVHPEKLPQSLPMDQAYQLCRQRGFSEVNVDLLRNLRVSKPDIFQDADRSPAEIDTASILATFGDIHSTRSSIATTYSSGSSSSPNGQTPDTGSIDSSSPFPPSHQIASPRTPSENDLAPQLLRDVSSQIFSGHSKRNLVTIDDPSRHKVARLDSQPQNLPRKHPTGPSGGGKDIPTDKLFRTQDCCAVTSPLTGTLQGVNASSLNIVDPFTLAAATTQRSPSPPSHFSSAVPSTQTTPISTSFKSPDFEKYSFEVFSPGSQLPIPQLSPSSPTSVRPFIGAGLTDTNRSYYMGDRFTGGPGSDNIPKGNFGTDPELRRATDAFMQFGRALQHTSRPGS